MLRVLQPCLAVRKVRSNDRTLIASCFSICQQDFSLSLITEQEQYNYIVENKNK